jgi:3-methyl-2-oxobutanoate hydroxymethyltransferase
MLGNFVGEIAPKFVKRYAEVGTVVEAAFRDYARDVRAGAFPGLEHCYQIDPADEALIREARTTHKVRPAPRSGGVPAVEARP